MDNLLHIKRKEYNKRYAIYAGSIGGLLWVPKEKEC